MVHTYGVSNVIKQPIHGFKLWIHLGGLENAQEVTAALSCTSRNSYASFVPLKLSACITTWWRTARCMNQLLTNWKWTRMKKHEIYTDKNIKRPIQNSIHVATHETFSRWKHLSIIQDICLWKMNIKRKFCTLTQRLVQKQG